MRTCFLLIIAIIPSAIILRLIYKKDVEKEFNTYLSTHTIKETSSNVDLQYIIKENLLTSADGETRSKAFSRVYAYLTSRGFERFVIKNMIKHNWLMVDKNYNLCFITYEDEEIQTL